MLVALQWVVILAGCFKRCEIFFVQFLIKVDPFLPMKGSWIQTVACTICVVSGVGC